MKRITVYLASVYKILKALPGNFMRAMFYWHRHLEEHQKTLCFLASVVFYWLVTGLIAHWIIETFK